MALINKLRKRATCRTQCDIETLNGNFYIYLSLRMDGRRRRLRMCRPWMTKSLWCHPMDLTVAIQMKMSCYYNSAIRDTMRSVFGAKRCLSPPPLLPNYHSCCYSWRLLPLSVWRMREVCRALLNRATHHHFGNEIVENTFVPMVASTMW